MSTSLLRSIRCSAALSRRANLRTGRSAFLSTQSGDDTKRPTALAKLHLEDGTTLTGRSFGCHEAVEGEVSSIGLNILGSLGRKNMSIGGLVGVVPDLTYLASLVSPCLRFSFLTGRFCHWYGWLPRISDRSFLSRSNSDPDFTHDRKLWCS